MLPVPPYATPTAEPFQVPEAIVPVLVMFPCTADGKVELIEGTPPELVISTPLLAVEICPMVLVADEYKMSFAVVVVG